VLSFFARGAAGTAVYPAFPASSEKGDFGQTPGHGLPRERAAMAAACGEGAGTGKKAYPHHILHKFQACTAIAWPWRADMVFGKYPFDRH
jgi:hypothetical protein